MEIFEDEYSGLIKNDISSSSAKIKYIKLTVKAVKINFKTVPSCLLKMQLLFQRSVTMPITWSVKEIDVRLMPIFVNLLRLQYVHFFEFREFS